MQTSPPNLKSMDISQLDHFFSISSCPLYTCVNTQKQYSPFEIAEMTHFLFSDTLSEKDLETILITLAHIEGKTIPSILKTFCDLQATSFKYFAECAYQESCMWNDIDAEGVEYIELYKQED